MRRAWFLFCLAAAVVATAPAAAQDGTEPADTGPSLEYRPPRQVLPEPKAPTPAPPISVFRESFGSFGISPGSFDGPVDVALDNEGYIYVLDGGNGRVQVFDNRGHFVLEWGNKGTRPGEFTRPSTLAVGPKGFVYVVDTGNHRVQRFGWTRNSSAWAKGGCSGSPPQHPDGRVLSCDSWGALGSRPGAFKDPVDVAFERGNGEWIWVLDAGNDRVQRFEVKDDPDMATGQRFQFEREFGRITGSRGGEFADQVSIAWSDERFGYVYLLGPACTVQQFTADGVLQGTWSAVAPEGGVCVPARIRSDNRNRYLYVLDSGNGLIARFHREGRFLTAIRGAERPFARPRGFDLAEDRNEFVVADTDNNLVQKFTLR